MLKNNYREICCITVTYGNRAHYVKSLVERLTQMGIGRIVIVDNGSEQPASGLLRRIESENPDNITVAAIGFNSGSAHGFSTGIQKALDFGSEILWILDDDNLPEAGALDILLENWNQLTPGQRNATAFTSFRHDRENFRQAAQSGDPMTILPSRNSFMGFNISRFFAGIGKPGRIQTEEKEFSKTSEVAASAYGGLWLHRTFIERSGLPDENYILYMDDFDFTYRFTLSGGKILMLSDSCIADVENSYYQPEHKGILYHSLLEASTDSVAYYTCRNVVYFSRKYLMTSRVSYLLNKFVFLVYITIAGLLRNKLKRLGAVYSAIRDAENNRMGLNPGFSLRK